MAIVHGELAGGVFPQAVVRVELGRIRPGLRLRTGEVSDEHVNVVALALSRGECPPVVLWRADNSIVDGYYRCLAARKLGYTHIECVYFDGGEDSAFLEALRANRGHGLPLTSRERQKAAVRLLQYHPEWSDRRIAEICVLAPGTIGRMRASLPANPASCTQPATRLGRDGKCRPVDPAGSRERIITALRDQPDRSLREIARVTGSSPATVRAVRAKLETQLTERSVGSSGVDQVDPGRVGVVDLGSQAAAWKPDQAVLSTCEGHDFAEWFEHTCLGSEWEAFVGSIPISRVYEVADEARRRATCWLDFAAAVEGRVKRR